jgi:hypothetical protein
MTLARRLNRLVCHWPHPADVLAGRLTEELRAASLRTLEDSAGLYRHCRGLLAAAALSEAATGRALTGAMTAVGFPAEGVRECIADMPSFFVLAFACLGTSRMSAWHRAPETERQRLNEYLDSLFSETERMLLNALGERLMATEPT